MFFKDLRVRDLMTVDVEAVQRTARPSEVRGLLRRRAYHHVPVLDGERLVGILSAVDIALVSLGGYVHDQGTVDAHLDVAFDLGKLMAVDVVTVRPDDTVQRAAERLGDGQFHALPVVDHDGRLVGILTSTDILRWLATAR